MHRSNQQHQVSKSGAFQINWDSSRDRTEDDTKVQSQISIPAAWSDLLEASKAELHDFPAIDGFLEYLDQNLPEVWRSDDPSVIQFLHRLDQLEDLAWAIELKRQTQVT